MLGKNRLVYDDDGNLVTEEEMFGTKLSRDDINAYYADRRRMQQDTADMKFQGIPGAPQTMEPTSFLEEASRLAKAYLLT